MPSGRPRRFPLLALNLFAGSLVDRVDYRKFYLLTISGQAVCSLLLALQGFLRHVPAAGVLGLLALPSCFGAGGGPASRTFIPHLLPQHHLAAGLALRRIAFQGAMLPGPALGGLVVGGLKAGACCLTDALTFVAVFYGGTCPQAWAPLPLPHLPARVEERRVLLAEAAKAAGDGPGRADAASVPAPGACHDD